MNRLSITIIIELQLIDQRREWKIILGNLSNEGKKKIHFPEEEDLFLKRGGKSWRGNNESSRVESSVSWANCKGPRGPSFSRIVCPPHNFRARRTEPWP